MLKRWRRGRGEDEDNDDGKPVGYNQEEKTVPPPSPEMGNKSAKRGTDMRPIMGYTPAAETAKKRSQSSKPRMSHKRTSTHTWLWICTDAPSAQKAYTNPNRILVDFIAKVYRYFPSSFYLLLLLLFGSVLHGFTKV